MNNSEQEEIDKSRILCFDHYYDEHMNPCNAYGAYSYCVECKKEALNSNERNIGKCQ